MNEHTFEAFYDAAAMQQSVRDLIAKIKTPDKLAEPLDDLLRALAHVAYVHGWSDAVTMVKR